MKLTREETAILEGKLGAGARKAMEILSALGTLSGSPDMVAVRSVQVSGVSYGNIGEHGLAFLEAWAAQGSRAVVPAFMNPGGADRRLWRSLGYPAAYVRKQNQVIAALEKLGVRPTLTCTPYHCGLAPSFGEHLAWAESSAVCFANSVLGARSNREGGPSAIAAALTGRTPRHTLHNDEGRRPTRLVEVRCRVKSVADAGALGCLIGKLVSEDPQGGVPYIVGAEPPDGPMRLTWLKALGAAMAASGSVGLFHLDGVTPEAVAYGRALASGAAKRSTVASLHDGHRALGTGRGTADLVAIGCPHASPEDLDFIAGVLKGRRTKLPLWIFVAEDVRRLARKNGSFAKLAKSGAVLVSDTCIVVSPLQELGIKTVATDSAKAAFYLPSHHGVGVHFASTEACVETALRGKHGA